MTHLKYNREGDLLFTCSKDSIVCVWYSQNGERLGTYNGHTGSVWSLDVTSDSSNLLTGSADDTLKVWDVETGKLKNSIAQKSAVKKVAFGFQSRIVLLVIEKRGKSEGGIRVYETKDLHSKTPNPKRDITVSGSKITVAGFGLIDKYIICGHEDGNVSQIDWKSGTVISKKKYFEDTVTDIQFSKDTSYCIISSKDATAKLVNCSDISLIKTYKSNTIVNSACITPVQPFVILGGGQDAASVTTTSSKDGNFECKFYHKIFENEIGKLKGHFGPVNYLAVKPDGKGMATCSEDGFIRIQDFDPDYYELKI